MFFLRKFDSAPGVSPRELIKTTNAYLPICIMHWVIKGERNSFITGDQGCGKTTMLKGLIRYIDPSYNIRVQELQFELNLRFSYPYRNIATFQETANIDAQEGLNLQKKTNGAVNIVGEVATAEQASHIIQTARVASLFAMGTHHAKTAEDLVYAIADNMLQLGIYRDKSDAVRVVSEIVNFDCHLDKAPVRHIDRITEVIQNQTAAYPSDDTKKDAPLETQTMEDAKEFFKRSTNPDIFTTQDIIVWEEDENNKFGRFKIVNMPSEAKLKDMRKVLQTQEDRDLFDRDMDMLQKICDGKEVKGFKEWEQEVLSY